MSLPQKQIRYTEDQYLLIERESEERHEYLDGQIYAMAGESPEHGAICTNLTGETRAQLKGTRCQAFAKDIPANTVGRNSEFAKIKDRFAFELTLKRGYGVNCLLLLTIHS